MQSFALKAGAVCLLFAGEALCIYAEVAAGRTAVTGTAGWGSHALELGWFMVSGVLLLGGYALFRQAPGTGPALGLALGGLGLVAALF